MAGTLPPAWLGRYPVTGDVLHLSQAIAAGLALSALATLLAAFSARGFSIICQYCGRGAGEGRRANADGKGQHGADSKRAFGES